MQYWWVSQKQTFNQEYDGSYMWSPKKDRAGRSNHSYVNMTLVLPGDRVFSYKDSKLVAIGVVRSRAYSAPKPREFGVTGEQRGGPAFLDSQTRSISEQHPIR
jgi:putative restriction endonuclease